MLTFSPRCSAGCSTLFCLHHLPPWSNLPKQGSVVLWPGTPAQRWFAAPGSPLSPISMQLLQDFTSWLSPATALRPSIGDVRTRLSLPSRVVFKMLGLAGNGLLASLCPCRWGLRMQQAWSLALLGMPSCLALILLPDSHWKVNRILLLGLGNMCLQ